MGKVTYFHQVRENYEKITEYYLVLQESGIITEDSYFGNKYHNDCSIWVGNDCNRFIEPPSKLVGFPTNGAI